MCFVHDAVPFDADTAEGPLPIPSVFVRAQAPVNLPRGPTDELLRRSAPTNKTFCNLRNNVSSRFRLLRKLVLANTTWCICACCVRVCSSVASVRFARRAGGTVCFTAGYVSSNLLDFHRPRYRLTNDKSAFGGEKTHKRIPKCRDPLVQVPQVKLNLRQDSGFLQRNKTELPKSSSAPTQSPMFLFLRFLRVASALSSLASLGRCFRRRS